MSDKAAAIGGIIDIMKSRWDLPADCNEGELFAYAEILFDRIAAGESKGELYAYLGGVQVENWTCRDPTPLKGSSTGRSPSSGLRTDLVPGRSDSGILRVLFVRNVTTRDPKEHEGRRDHTTAPLASSRSSGGAGT